MNGDRWKLPDGREALECGRGLFTLQVIPMLDCPPYIAPREIVWRPLCTKQPSRYLHGAIPAEPEQQDRP